MAFPKESLCLLLVAMLISVTTSFNASFGPRVAIVLPVRGAALSMSSGKGFGSSPSPPPSEPDTEEKEEAPASPVTSSPPPLNQGQIALEKMRRRKAEQRDAELRKVREVRSMDDLVKDDRDAAAIPEKVAMRMGKRMLPFVGIPLIGGTGAFVAFWYLATYKDMEFQPAVVAGSTIAVLVVGLLGITYSVMSASWDPDREGSTIGTDEFSKNLGSLQDGLKRSRENTIIREKMAGMPEAEIEAAIRDLDEREAQKIKKRQSLGSKLEEDLE